MTTLPPLPVDYVERVYAGILGKIIGVYLGRPFEGWSHREILEKLGEVNYYVHDQLGSQLVVTDDDISGTFTFLRALADYDFSSTLTAEQIGQTWMNYIIENRTILWWGGMGMSTEHTAFLRMKHGIMPPHSGSIAKNGQVVAEQIGAQIFIDGWGLINPGDPERAADFARRAGSVSHDGEAIYCAQIVAALIAEAFVTHDINRLLNTAIKFIPADSLTAKMIEDIRGWHAEGLDWRSGFGRIEQTYGYDKYGGNCHTIPNHAIIVHALLHANDNFQRALMIANTCGWDTDCNSGNVGCIMAVRGGLEGINAGPDWRGPIADKIYLPTADGGRCVTDAVTETYRVVETGRRLRNIPYVAPKNGARFHFSAPGSAQGFSCDSGLLSNRAGSGLVIDLEPNTESARVVTETFPSPIARKMGGYELVASPTIYPGQTIEARVIAPSLNDSPLTVSLTIGCYGPNDLVSFKSNGDHHLTPGSETVLRWTVPDTGGYPISEVGLEIGPRNSGGQITLDYLTWSGTPNVTFRQVPGTSWKAQWVNGVSDHATWGEPFRLVQNEGTGLLMTGCREWSDYRVESTVTPHLVEFGGIAARVQGMKRYYALVLVRGRGVRIVKALDGDRELATAPFDWTLGESHRLAIKVVGNQITGYVNGVKLLETIDDHHPLLGGGIGLILAEGRMATHEVRVSSVSASGCS